MIFNELRLHKLDFSVLAVLASIFTAYFVLTRHSPDKLFLSTIVFAGSYVIWGAWHHHKSHHLSIQVVLEYFLVALLGICLVSTLLI